MLLFLNAAQLLLYIGILALLGQGLLFILAGTKRETNVFYQLFPFVAFCVVAILYLAVTVAKIEHCVSVGMVGCK